MSPTASPSTESSLLRRVQTHDAAAWRAFADLYGPLIYAWCRRAGLSQEDAADVLQETLVAVARGIGGFRREGNGSFRAWLWAVKTNKVRDHIRRREPGQQAVGGSDMQLRLQQLPDEVPSQETDAPAQRDLQSLVHRGLAQVQAEFEPRTWRAFCLTVLEERDTASVAAELNMTPASVRQSKSRVLRRLRDQFGEFLK